MIPNHQEQHRLPPKINEETFLKKLYSVFSALAHPDIHEIQIKITKLNDGNHLVTLMHGDTSHFFVYGVSAGFFERLLNRDCQKELLEESDATDS